MESCAVFWDLLLICNWALTPAFVVVSASLEPGPTPDLLSETAIGLVMAVFFKMYPLYTSKPELYKYYVYVLMMRVRHCTVPNYFR